MSNRSPRSLPSFNPILTLRFAISLRKSADPEGSRKWQLTHFNTPHFAAAPPSDIQVTVVRDSGIEMGLVDPSCDRVKVYEP